MVLNKSEQTGMHIYSLRLSKHFLQKPLTLNASLSLFLKEIETFPEDDMPYSSFWAFIIHKGSRYIARLLFF